MTYNDFIGREVVGYRYGFAPDGSCSYNHAENTREPGLSMATIGYMPEVASFAVLENSERAPKKYYYKGEIAGTGSDGEACLANAERITYNEFRRLRSQNRAEYNDIIQEAIRSETEYGTKAYYYDVFNPNIIDAWYNYQRRYKNTADNYLLPTPPEHWIETFQRIEKYTRDRIAFLVSLIKE